MRKYIRLNLSLIFLLLAACSPTAPNREAIFVDITNLQPLPETLNQATPFRMAIAAVISPEGTLENYRPLVNYIEQKLEKPVELIQRSSYAELNDLIKKGEVDLAIVCTGSYIIGQEELNVKLLAAPVANGETYYFSHLIVRDENRARSMSDLRGSVFAFTDPLSLSGKVYPTYLLAKLDEKPESFFEKTFYTRSHDDSIRAVVNRLADAASVHSLVFEYMIEHDPGLSDQLRVIDTSEPFGIPPILVSEGISPKLQDQLADIFLNMHLSEEGRWALQSLNIEKFTRVSLDLYDTAAQIYSSAENQNIDQ